MLLDSTGFGRRSEQIRLLLEGHPEICGSPEIRRGKFSRWSSLFESSFSLASTICAVLISFVLGGSSVVLFDRLCQSSTRKRPIESDSITNRTSKSDCCSVSTTTGQSSNFLREIPERTLNIYVNQREVSPFTVRPNVFHDRSSILSSSTKTNFDDL